jgi:site-specific recombinase XerD
MLEELQRRNYSESTIRAYIRTVEHYSRHFHRSPDQLGPEHIRQYQAAMFREWKLAPNTVTQKLAALRFFYVQVLKRSWSVAETPYPKKVLHLPQVLSPQEVARLIDAAEMPFHRILLMTLYATGARLSKKVTGYPLHSGSHYLLWPFRWPFFPWRRATKKFVVQKTNKWDGLYFKST